jgi:hypothetical protein
MKQLKLLPLIKFVSGGEYTHDPDVKIVGGSITNPAVKVTDNISKPDTNVTVSPYVVVSPDHVNGGGVNLTVRF